MAYRITAKHEIPLACGRGAPLKYPFASMAAGDSINVKPSERLSARRAAYLYGERHGQTFRAKGTRIWRVS